MNSILIYHILTNYQIYIGQMIFLSVCIFIQFRKKIQEDSKYYLLQIQLTQLSNGWLSWSRQPGPEWFLIT